VTKREEKRRKELLDISSDSSIEARERRKEAILSGSSFESSASEGSLKSTPDMGGMGELERLKMYLVAHLN